MACKSKKQQQRNSRFCCCCCCFGSIMDIKSVFFVLFWFSWLNSGGVCDVVMFNVATWISLCSPKIYSWAVVAEEQDLDLTIIIDFLASDMWLQCRAWWWCCRWCLWWSRLRWHLFKHSPSELVLCYLTIIGPLVFLIGGSDEQRLLDCWLVEWQWLSDDCDVAIETWLLCRRTDNDFFCREISLRSSDNFFSISRLR